jgi:hypothetical protein
VVRTANVQPSLGWLTREGSGITFNPQSNKYELVFHNWGFANLDFKISF